MKLATLLHNPSAGDEEHKKEQLISLVQSNGFECNYSSMKKKGWKEIDKQTDFLIIAGGDGTVRQVLKELLKRPLIDKQFPIAILPMGTANNIAATLGLTGDEDTLIKAWHHEKIKEIDIGKISGPDEDFFLEGFGFGVFPRLMKKMGKLDTDSLSPEEKLKKALEILGEIIDSYTPKLCELHLDGTDYSGRFLLLEVMNICSIGPNLNLAPQADPGDGFFEVVLVTENQREELKQYILDKLNGIEKPLIANTVKAKNILVKWEGMLAHADDQVIEIDKKEIKLELQQGVFKFFAGK